MEKRPTPYKKRRRVGLALSGGSLRGVSHIGVLKVLEENRIPIDMIAGTSSGAIVAALYASGYTVAEMRTLVKSVSLPELIDIHIKMPGFMKKEVKSFVHDQLRFISSLPMGLISGVKIDRLFTGLWQNRTVKDTVIPLAITAVDVYSGDTVFFVTPLNNRRKIENARYYIQTMIADAVRASISIPGIFLPKEYGDMLLVDGAVKNNLPTDILHQMGADFIIGVDLGYDGRPNHDIHSMTDILMQCIQIMGREVTLLKSKEYAHVIIRPDTGSLNHSDLSAEQRIDELILCGEQAAKNKLSELQSKLFM
ncbi:patatin-like phospholipase family protein [Acetonema longum]|uniref:patatin-like phospholipase family protein n=1 Tax=Acetonema longum TaxID=2374 RepID=UPI0005914C09|nr:patatin-like phospholipase family protein [Acetonema longum]